MFYSATGNQKVANLSRRAQQGDARSLERLMGQHESLVHVVARRQWRGYLVHLRHPAFSAALRALLVCCAP